MRVLAVSIIFVSLALAQPAPDSFARAAQVLQWRVAVADGSQTVVYRPQAAPGDMAAWTREVANAAKSGARVIVASPPAELLDGVAKTAADNNIALAVEATSGSLLDPERALEAVRKYDKRVRLWVDPAAWEKAGTRPLAAIYMLREYLGGATLAGGRLTDEFLREAYRLDIKPLVWTVAPAEVKSVSSTIDALVSYHQSYASRTQGVRRLSGVSPEERARIEAALPASAPASPKKARKLLVFDLNVGRFGHPSIPYANLAMELMGKKTGAFEAIVTSDPGMLQPARLKEFDAVYLNNTIGDIFSTAEAQDGFAEYVKNGGGVMGNHATTVTMTEWPEFGNILGARGASHRMTDEKVVINVEDPGQPIVKALGSAPFEYADEIFRFQPPYSREKVRVLLSVDPLKTDMNQGRCYGQCYRDDNDYPIAWIHQYGKGRVFYTTLGHNPHVFWQPNLLQMFLAAAQYTLGDLDADASPQKMVSGLDAVLPDVARYDWGQEEAPVRRLERAMGMLPPGAEASRSAEEKLLAVLRARPKLGAVDAITRHLAVVGGPASVPVLAAMLADKQTADMARYALERIDAPEAVAAIRSALPKATDVRTQTGMIHSLARRRDAASVPVLQKLAVSNEAGVSGAAINALGMIGTADAERALLALAMRPGVAEALLTVAERAPADRSSAIYTRLYAMSNPEEVRVAAIYGLARTGNSDSVLKALQDAAPNIQTAAVLNLPPAALLPAMDKLSSAIRIQALHALTAHADKSAKPAFVAATKNSDVAVRIAALQGLAEIGSGEDVPLLLVATTAADAQERAAARLALSLLAGPEVDAAIVSAMGSATGKPKVELIRTTGERGIASAQDALLVAARDTDAAVRRESLRALRGIAQPARTPVLLELLLQASEEDRKDAERAVAAAIGRSDKPDVKPVFEAYEKATGSQTRASLLSVMALTGHKDALPVLRKALEAADGDVQRAAIAGLSEWSSPDPIEDLMRVAQTSNDPAVKVLALRGYIRLVQRPAGRPGSETAKLLGQAMAAATRTDEKKAVLAALQQVITHESLVIAQNATSDPSVAAEAKLAVSTLEGALGARGR